MVISDCLPGRHPDEAADCLPWCHPDEAADCLPGRHPDEAADCLCQSIVQGFHLLDQAEPGQRIKVKKKDLKDQWRRNTFEGEEEEFRKIHKYRELSPGILYK